MASPGVFTGSDIELLALGHLLLSLTVPHTHTHTLQGMRNKNPARPNRGRQRRELLGRNVCSAELNDTAAFSAIRREEKRKEIRIVEVLKVSQSFSVSARDLIYAMRIYSTFRTSCSDAEQLRSVHTRTKNKDRQPTRFLV